MRSVRLLLKLILLIMFMTIVLMCNDKNNISKNEQSALKVDHWTDANAKDLRAKKRKLDFDINRIIKLKERAIIDLRIKINKFTESKSYADSIISDYEYNKDNLRHEIQQKENVFADRKAKLQKFEERNKFQLEIDILEQQLIQLDRDLNLLKIPSLDEIEKEDITERYNEIFVRMNLNKRLKEVDKNSNDYLIKVLKVWQDSLYDKINKQAQQIKNKIHEIKININQDSSEIESKKKISEHINIDIQETENFIKSEETNFIADTTKLKEKIESYYLRENQLIAEKYAIEIALIEKQTKLITKPPEDLLELIKKTREFHEAFVQNLLEQDIDLVSEQIKALKQYIAINIENLNWKIDEIKDLENLVKGIFRDVVFKNFLVLGDTIPIDEPKYKKSINSFYSSLPIIKRFLNIYPDYKIYIDGYADRLKVLSDTLFGNKDLSRRRAIYARNRLREAQIPDSAQIPHSNIVVDWYGEYHSLTDPRKIDISGWQENRRIDMCIIGPMDTNKVSLDYLNFKNNYTLKFDKEVKVFFHEKGVWKERNNKLKFGSEVYDSLTNHHKLFKELTDLKPSPIFKGGFLQLGNEFEMILPIDRKKYWIIVGRIGAESINDLSVREIRYLLN